MECYYKRILDESRFIYIYIYSFTFILLYLITGSLSSLLDDYAIVLWCARNAWFCCMRIDIPGVHQILFNECNLTNQSVYVRIIHTSIMYRIVLQCQIIRYRQ